MLVAVQLMLPLRLARLRKLLVVHYQILLLLPVKRLAMQ